MRGEATCPIKHQPDSDEILQIIEQRTPTGTFHINY